MTTSALDTNEQVSQDHADETAAFNASFQGDDSTAISAKSDLAPEAKAAPEPAAPTPDDNQDAAKPATPPASEAAPTAPSPKADEPDLKAEMRKLHGRIGALNDQLQQALKTKETEGKPAVLSKVQLTRLKDEYPEMADMLEGDIADVIAAIATKSADPKEIQALVQRGVAEEVAKFREESVTDQHENWKTDCWATFPSEDSQGERTPEYAAWLKTMTPEEAAQFENSNSPAFVNRKLGQFYDWKNRAAKAETEKKSRLSAAITPQGTARANPQNLSDEEAVNKAFMDAYES